ncbi:MAG: hypothetical protein AAF798_09720, partial [Bacteroidota bacterium]
MTYQELFNSMSSQIPVLLEKFDIKTCHVDPCYISEIEDFPSVFESAIKSLFPEQDIKSDKKLEIVGDEYLYKLHINGQAINIPIHKSTKDFFQVFEESLEKVKNMVNPSLQFAHLQPGAGIIVGLKSNLLNAKSNGLPTQVGRKIDWFTNIYDKRIDKSEEFHIQIHISDNHPNGELAFIEDCLLSGINRLAQNSDNINSYTENEIKFVYSKPSKSYYICL